MAVRTDVASRRMPRTRRVPPCSRTKRSSASCSRCSARSPVPFGTTCSTATCAPKRLPRSRARRMASSACGPPRTGTRIELHVVHAALLDHRDVARRLAHHRVDGRREDRRSVAPRPARRLRPRGSGRRRRAAPAEDDEVGAFLPHRLDDAVGGAPPDADHGPDLDALLVAEGPAPAAAAGARCAPGWRPRDRETPSGTSTMPSAVISVARPLLTPEPMRTRSRAVRGLASGSRMRYGARRRGGIRVPRRPRRASPASASPGTA